ncbi:MAG: tRNA (adenosine(37)-N6)-threonylcarbamoyltransferase complex ATPase subunit type 1 TsaE [Saprospiraceae bacterium]
MQQTYFSQTLDDLPLIASQILHESTASKIFALTGQLGAGKTTLTKSLCQYFGYHGEVTSPTFSLINEYPTSDHGLIYHMDLYRIKDTDEAIDIGIEEYLFSGRYCFIEWPDIIYPLMSEPYYAINIGLIDHHQRKIEVQLSV